MFSFEIYKDKSGKWRWRLRHSNRNVIATSGQGYVSRSNAKRSVDRLKVINLSEVDSYLVVRHHRRYSLKILMY